MKALNASENQQNVTFLNGVFFSFHVLSNTKCEMRHSYVLFHEKEEVQRLCLARATAGW